MRVACKVLILLEVIVCFAPMTALWLLGALLTPGMLGMALTAPSGGFDGFLRALWVFGSVLGGACGLVALAALLCRLLGTRRPLKRPALLLAGVALGVLPILPYVLIPQWVRIFALAPLAATAHLVYLSRGILYIGFAHGPANDPPRP